MKIAFLTDGKSPVPATKGGAVENLIEDLLDENEKKHKFDFSVLSIYEKQAGVKANKYRFTNFYFVKCIGIVKVLDKLVYLISKYIFKKKNLISYRFIFQRLYIMSKYPRILLKNNFDRIVVVTNSTLFLILKNKKIAKKYEGKVSYYLHNEVRSLFKCEKEISSIRSLIGISQFVNDSFIKRVSSVSSDKCFIVKNGIDTDLFKERNNRRIEEYRKKFHINSNDFVIVFAGRLVREKGALETIKAIKICNDRNIKLLIVGSGFYCSDVVDAYLFELKKEAELIKDQIVFTGYIDYNNMPSIYHLADLAILPSIWDEPAGMTMVEAVVSGLPLITTNSGGIPEYISEDLAIILERNEKLVENIAQGIKNVRDKKIVFDPISREDIANELSLVRFFDNFAMAINEEFRSDKSE